jgi:hypothetical protein
MWMRSGLKLIDDDLRTLAMLLEASVARRPAPPPPAPASPQRVADVRTALFYGLFE